MRLHLTSLIAGAALRVVLALFEVARERLLGALRAAARVVGVGR